MSFKGLNVICQEMILLLQCDVEKDLIKIYERQTSFCQKNIMLLGGYKRLFNMTSIIYIYIYCIYIRQAIKFVAIDLAQFCDEKNLEICALKIMIVKQNLLVICVYRSPSGNFDYFINELEKVLKFLHIIKTEFIICGDFNVNFLNETERKTKLLLLLQSFNVFNTVQFPTRITESSSSIIDNIFIDNIRRNFLCLSGAVLSPPRYLCFKSLGKALVLWP
jgi:exonuclease III